MTQINKIDWSWPSRPSQKYPSVATIVLRRLLSKFEIIDFGTDVRASGDLSEVFAFVKRSGKSHAVRPPNLSEIIEAGKAR